jgi:hypothetical protein
VPEPGKFRRVDTLEDSRKDSMANVTLRLGPIYFSEFELPSQVNFGGEQRLTVHRLTDGRRVVDCMGRDEADITFAGVFSGPNATVRAREVDSLRVGGEITLLTWDEFVYSVIVNRFDAEYQTNTWIPYRLKCLIVRDEAYSPMIEQTPLQSSVVADVSNACAGVSVLGLDLLSVVAATNASGSTVLGSGEYVMAQNSIVSARSAVSAQMASAENIMETTETANPTSPRILIANLLSAVGYAEQLGILSSAGAYLGRAAINLANAST